MGLLGGRLFVGFDVHSMVVALLSRGPGRRRVEAFGRRPLGSGALVPSPAGHNVARREEVREALSDLLGTLAPRRSRATLVLPDGIARLAVASPPSGAEPRDYLRFRMASSLPWPASEAIVDLLPVGGRQVVGAAVRRSTVTEYEQLAGASGLTVDRVHLGPLLALECLLRQRARTGVHVILGDAAFCLVVLHDGQVTALRSRRRDPSQGEGERLVTEATRAAREPVDGLDPSRPILLGSGASRLREELGFPALDPVAHTEWPEAKEVGWLDGALA